MRHLESQIQTACIKYFRYQYPSIARLLFSVPNGAKRNRFTGGIEKSQGLTAGVADLLLLVPNKTYNMLCAEIKTQDGKQSDLQKSWQELAESKGNKYVICRSFDEFRNEIESYLAIRKSNAS